MADVRLPSTLGPLFPGLPRQLDVEAATVSDVIDQLESEWPGIRDRLCEPGPALRRHIHVYVNRERAKLETPVADEARVDVIAAISGGGPRIGEALPAQLQGSATNCERNARADGLSSR
jgi:molybdopterin converting factor small subunit